MCPGTIALVAAGVSAAGAIGSGIAAGNAANYQAQVATNNATVAQQNAAYSASAGAAQTEAAGLKAKAQNAGVRAGIAANGVDVNSGSAVDVQASERETGALNVATVANNAALSTYGYETQNSSFESQATLDRSQATSDYAGGFLKAAGTLASNPTVDSFGSSLLSGAPSTPSNYQWMATPNANNNSDIGFG